MRFKRVLLCIAIGVLWTGSVFAATNPVSSWNLIVSQAALAAGQSPPVLSRTLAIVQVAVHDALNSINSRYEPYALSGSAPAGAFPDAAVAAAARDAAIGAIAVGPFAGFGMNQAAAVASVDTQYMAFLAAIPDGISKLDGIAVGQAA